MRQAADGSRILHDEANDSTPGARRATLIAAGAAAGALALALAIALGSCAGTDPAGADAVAAPEVVSPFPLYAHPGGCLVCHEPGEERRLRHPKQSLCASSGCHDALVGPGERAHGPIVLGDCVACHLPHSAAHPHVLLAGDRALCGRCHGTLISCPSASVDAGACSGCHSAHGGRGDHFLLPGVIVGMDSHR